MCAHVIEQAGRADELHERVAGGDDRLLDVKAMSTSARNQPQPASPKSAAVSGIGDERKPSATACAEMVRRGSTVRVR
jgi:hypothetical protein